LMLAPLHVAVRDVGAIALAGCHGFLKCGFSARATLQTARPSTVSPRSEGSATPPRRAHPRQSPLPSRATATRTVLARNGVRLVSASARRTLPVSPKRRAQAIAVR
jgi:hypothetical protein